MNYDAMGAVPAGYAPRMAPQVGAVPGYYPQVGQAYPLFYPGHFDIIGQQRALARVGAADTNPPAENKGVWNWLQQEGPLGVKRLYWAGGAAAVGLTWLAWYQGWIGDRKHAGDYDFDF